MIYNQSR